MTSEIITPRTSVLYYEYNLIDNRQNLICETDNYTDAFKMFAYSIYKNEIKRQYLEDYCFTSRIINYDELHITKTLYHFPAKFFKYHDEFITTPKMIKESQFCYSELEKCEEVLKPIIIQEHLRLDKEKENDNA